MRWLILVLSLMLVVLLGRLLFGEGSYAHKAELQQRIDQQARRNRELEAHRDTLSQEVEDLKSGLESIEERARSDLGMIEKDETFFFVVEPEQPAPTQEERQ